MDFRRVGVVTAIVAGLAVVSAATLVGAAAVLHSSAGVPAAGEAVPILGPITPAGHPYDEIALLRRQRMSDDVLPASLVTSLTQNGGLRNIVADSARLLIEHRNEREYLVVEASGGLCIYSVTLGEDGYIAGCRSAPTTYAPGTEVIGGGAGGFDDKLQIVADGTPAPGVVSAGSRHLAPNVWLGRTSKGIVPNVPTVAHDPLAVPLTTPYSEFAILRRAATAADTEPTSWTTDDDGLAGSVLAGSLRRAADYRGTTIWVGAQSDGTACLIAAPKGVPDMSACGTDGVSLSLGDNGSGGTIALQKDHTGAADVLGPGSRRLAENVWVLPAN